MKLGFLELSIICILVLLLFGAGKLPQVMKEIAKGVKWLKKEVGGG